MPNPTIKLHSYLPLDSYLEKASTSWVTLKAMILNETRGLTSARKHFERMNGEICDREKVTRNLKKDDSPILTGLQIYHNFVRPHMGLNSSSPSEKAGITVKGQDKWLTLIQNATQQRREREN